MKRLLIVLSLLGLVLAACATPAGPVVSEVTPTPVAPTPTHVPVDATGKPNPPPFATPRPEPTGAPTDEPTHVPVDMPPVQRAAVAAAMLALGLPVNQVKLVSIEPVDWPDGCLGVTHMGMMCIKGPVPGFRIVLEANGKQYEFHTNLDASVVTPASGPAVEVPGAIVGRVVTALASALGISDGDIKVVSTQIIEWPDSCLGVAAPGIACAQMVTPGYLVVLQAKGQQYEYHTNGNASVVKPASLALSWQRNGGIAGFADSLTVFRSGEVHADWSGAPNGRKDSTLSALSPDQQAQLQGWLAKFGTVSVSHHDPANATDQMAIDLTLIGSGSAQPSAAEQQAMLDWATNVLTGLQK